MECKNAYRKDGINYILCRCAGEPDPRDTHAICHAMCGFQRFCPNIRDCTLLPGWTGCTRLKAQTLPRTAQEAAGSGKEAGAGSDSPKKRTRKKGAETSGGEDSAPMP